MTPDAINLAIALWGAITGTIAITLSVIQYYVERPRLQLQWLRNFAIMALGSDGRMRGAGPTIARLVVTNVGRQNIRVIGAYGAKRETDGTVGLFMFSDGLLDASANRVLAPENPSTEFQINEGPHLDEIVFVAVNDGFGRSHVLWLVSWFQKLAVKRRFRQMKAKKAVKAA
ncbi:MAG TPA: hypothetical protein VMO47_00540 [Rhodothermales bacterium]|nr:hypothetical protein [Rhodothermales bacterium]